MPERKVLLPREAASVLRWTVDWLRKQTRPGGRIPATAHTKDENGWRLYYVEEIMRLASTQPAHHSGSGGIAHPATMTPRRAAQYLGIDYVDLDTYVTDGRIPPDAYVNGAGGRRMFNPRRIVELEREWRAGGVIPRWFSEKWLEDKLHELLPGFGWSVSMINALLDRMRDDKDDEDEECE